MRSAEPYGVCGGHCGRPMLSQREWREHPERREGHARHGGRGLCNTCYVVASRRGTLPGPPPVPRGPGRGRRRQPPRTQEPLSASEVARLRALVGVS
jgi:hypothetical protein